MPIIFIAFLDPQLLLAPLLFTVAFVCRAARLHAAARARSPARMREQFGTMNAGLAETVTGIEVVKSTAQEAQERRKFERERPRATATPSCATGGSRRATCRRCCSASRSPARFLHGLCLVDARRSSPSASWSPTWG